MITPSKKTEQPETRENAGDQVAIGLNFELIGLEIDANFLDQSKSEVKLYQRNPGLL